MAFQKTKGRTEFIRPNGMPDLSGFQAAARQYSQLADVAMSVGTGIRRDKYNDAILEAEIAGKTAGARYEKNPETGQMELVPLTNLDYAKASSMYSQNEREGVLKAYRKAAISQYAMSAKLDVEATATKALKDFPNDPDSIRSVAEGHFASLSKLDPEIYASLAPSAVYAFTTVENQALAQQQKEEKALSIQTHKRALSSNTRKIANLTAKGTSETDDNVNSGIQAMMNELLDENEQIYETLKTNGVSDTEIAQMRELQTNVVASRAGQAHVERAFVAGGMPAALTAIETIMQENYENSGIDSDRLGSVLSATANKLQGIESAQRTLDSRVKEQIYHKLIKDIVVDGASVDDMLGDPDSLIYSLDGSRIASLTQQGRGLDRNIANEKYNANIGYITNWKGVLADSGQDERLIADAYYNIRELHDREDISSGQWQQARLSFVEYTDHIINGKSREKAGLYIAMELGANSSYARTPADFASEEFINDLVGRGIIGNTATATWKNTADYINDINSYAVEHNKFYEKKTTARIAYNTAKKGGSLTSAEAEALADEYGTDVAVLDNGEVVDMNFYDEDEAVVQASIDTADVFTAKFNGAMHPRAMRVMKDAMRSEETAETALAILFQTSTGLALKEDIPQDEAMDQIFRINGFTEDQRRFFRIASNIGIPLALEDAKFERRTNTERDISSVVSAGKDNMSKFEASEAFFDEALSGAMGAHGFYNFFDFDQQGPDRQAVLENFVVGTGIDVDDLKNVVIQDSELKRSMKNLFFERLVYETKLGMSPKDVMFGVFRDIGHQYGVEKDPETGVIYYKKQPILSQAQSTVPLMESGTAKGKPIFRMEHKFIEQDVVKGFLNPDVPESALSTDLVRDLKDVMRKDGNPFKAHLTFTANESIGASNDPSYTVILTDRFGNDKIISDKYKFNYHRSHLNEDFEKAYSLVKSQRVKQYMRLGGALDPFHVQNKLRAFAQSRDKRALYSIIEMVNDSVDLTEGTAFDISDFQITNQEVEDFLIAYKYITSLGYY